jgi:hypothetical protein
LLAEGLEKDLAEMRQAHETYKAEYDAKLEVLVARNGALVPGKRCGRGHAAAFYMTWLK